MTEPVIDPKDFPTNSLRSRTMPQPQKPNDLVSESKTPAKIEKVVTSEVTIRKRSLLDRFAKTFFGNDAKGVLQYVIWDVVIPSAKSTLVDMIRIGSEMLIFGKEQGPGGHIKRERGRSFIDYGGVFKNRDREFDERERYSYRARHNFDDVIIRTRAEAENILSHLVDQIYEYGEATVADFYDACGITTEFTDQKYGWTNLSTAEIRQNREGYYFIMPKARALK